jgi:hypothetical protein
LFEACPGTVGLDSRPGIQAVQEFIDLLVQTLAAQIEATWRDPPSRHPERM